MPPSIFERVNHAIFEPCMLPDETYADQTRKYAVLALAFMAANAFCLGLPILIISEVYNPSAGSVVTCSLLLQCSVTSALIPYWYMRATKQLPQWLVDLQVWATLPCTLCLILFVPQAPCAFVTTIVSYTAIIMRVRLWGLMLFYAFGTCVISALLMQFREDVPSIYNALETPHTLAERIMYTIGGALCPILYLGLGLHLVMKQFLERSNQADAAIVMNLAIAEKLLVYDTEGVAAILAINKEKVDCKLYLAFSGIQRNLEEFRPHIPDYVIAATLTDTATDTAGHHETEASDEGDVESSIRLDDTLSTQNASATDRVHPFVRSPEVQARIATFEPTDEANDAFSQCHMSSTLISDSDFAGGSMISGSTITTGGPSGHAMSIRPSGLKASAIGSNVNLVSLVAVPSMSTPPRGGMQQSRISSGKGGNSSSGEKNGALSSSGKTKYFYGRASTVFVRFVAESSGSVKNTDGSLPKRTHYPTVVEGMNKVVENASHLAKTYKGALQYMQGCGLMISFNAASRVVAHESKACAFALDLQRMVMDMEGAPFVVHASVVTTHVLAFFAGNKGQLLLTVIGGYMPVHTAMHHFMCQSIGDDVSCILVNKGALSAIEHHFEIRTLGAIILASSLLAPARLETKQEDCDTPVSPLMGSKEFVLRADAFQLVAARGKSTDDEWMYELENHRNPHLFTKQIVDAAHTGDLTFAKGLLAEHSAAIAADVILTRCLTQRIDYCEEHNVDFTLRKIPPTKMW